MPGAEVSVVGIDHPADRSFAVEVEPDRLGTLKVIVRQPRENVTGSTQHFTFEVKDKSGVESDRYETIFYTPDMSK
jgi:hypothetical protein